MDTHFHVRKRVRHRVSAVTSNISPSLLPKIPESCIPISGPPQELVIRGHSVHHRGETSKWGRQGQVSIDILPDEVLLEIFEIDTVEEYSFLVTNRWHTLVHVCRRWRSVVFASTHRLNLRLRCTYTTPVREMLDIWPALPIVILGCSRTSRWGSTDNMVATRAAVLATPRHPDNIVAALEHPDRVHRIELLDTRKSDLKRFAAAMKDPFPALTDLWLRPASKMVSVLPDSFLGGSAPRLRTVELDGIPFPAMPKLLSSASDLFELDLRNIPHSGYVSPEAMATGLSALTRLEKLRIEFQSHRSRPDEPSPPPSIRTILPALKSFQFKGVCEYLEDLTSRIDAPLLSDFRITFFNQLIFNTRQLCAFISRAEKSRSHSQTEIEFSNHYIKLSLRKPYYMVLELTVLCKAPDWQLSSLTQFCDPLFPSLCNLERLDMRGYSYSRRRWQQDVEHTQWLELLHPFTTVKRLSLPMDHALRIVPALQELSEERILGVLPALQGIFIPESSLSRSLNVKKAFAQFVTARQLSGHPVTVAVIPRGQE